MSAENAAMAQWLREVAADESTPPHAIRGMRVAYDRAMRRPRQKVSSEAIEALLTERGPMTSAQLEAHFSATYGIIKKWRQRLQTPQRRVRICAWKITSTRGAPMAVWAIGSEPDAPMVKRGLQRERWDVKPPGALPSTAHALHPMGIWGGLAQS